MPQLALAQDLALTVDPVVEVTFPQNVDSTMLSLFDECAQKFFYEFILRRVPHGRSVHLHAGGCFALAMETIRRSFYTYRLPWEDCLLHGFEAFTKAWGMYNPPEKEYKDFINVWGAVEAYFREYPPATDYFQPFMKENGEPAVEFKFAIPMHYTHPETGQPILFSGRIDLLAQNEPTSCYVVDEKTTKSLGDAWYKKWDMRGQFYGYTYAGRVYGFPVAGALIRGIAIQQTQYGFAEKPVLYTDDQLKRWWHTANERLGRMLYLYEITRLRIDQGMQAGNSHEEILGAVHAVWPMSFGEACVNFGRCQFTDLCTKPDQWNYYQTFEKRIWNPLAHDPTAESEDRMSQLGEQSLEELLGDGDQRALLTYYGSQMP